MVVSNSGRLPPRGGGTEGGTGGRPAMGGGGAWGGLGGRPTALVIRIASPIIVGERKGFRRKSSCERMCLVHWGLPDIIFS